MRMRNQIVEEIMTVINDKVKNDNYDLVFDKSGQSLNGVPVVLHSQDNMEFSDDVITALNKSRPTLRQPRPRRPRSPTKPVLRRQTSNIPGG